MNNPWLMLATLFIARTATGFVFQSIGSAGPAIAAGLAIDFALIGTLIGLYKVPGIALSLPSGMLTKYSSDRVLIGASLLIMGLGCGVTAAADSYAVAAAGRLVTGIGGTVSNLYFTKVTLDWFSGSKSVPLAMGILVNSWPVGIALGLMLQGPMTTSWGWQNAMVVSCLSAFVAAGLIFTLYREAPHRSLAPASGWASLKALSAHEWLGLSLIGIVWSFINVGLALVFGFAPALLTSLGFDLGKAGQLVAIGTWVGIVAIPLGGALVTKIGHGRLFILICTIASAVVYAALAIRPDSMLLYVAFGITAFAAAGPIMALPSGVLTPPNRAAGMGVFYTVYYLAMGILPGVAGMLHDALGPRAPLIFAAVLMLISVVAQGGVAVLDRSRLRVALV